MCVLTEASVPSSKIATALVLPYIDAIEGKRLCIFGPKGAIQIRYYYYYYYYYYY